MNIVARQELSSEDLKTLVDLYIRSFAQPPYNESFEEQYVRDYIQNYYNQILYVCYDGERPIGMLCAEYTHKFDDVIGKHMSSYIYLSELIVSPDYRRQGLGLAMVQKFLEDYPKACSFLRTAEIGNQGVINFYKKLNFRILDIVQEVQNTRTDGRIDTDRRIFMVHEPQVCCPH